ncbi:MAG: phosphate ABC transporter permease PstA [Puniceicoccales bacterium]
MNMRPAGEMFVWLTAMGLAAGIIMVIGLLWIIVANGVEVFWPRTIYELKLKEGNQIFGQSVVAASIVEDRDKKVVSDGGELEEEYKIFVGNKDVFGQQFQYIDQSIIASKTVAEGIMVAEREGSGNAIFYPVEITLANGTIIAATSPEFMSKFKALIEEADHARDKARRLDRGPIGRYAAKLKKLHLEQRLNQEKNPTDMRGLQDMDRVFRQLQRSPDDATLKQEYQSYVEKGPAFEKLAQIHAREQELDAEFAPMLTQSAELRESISKDTLKYRLIDGTERSQPVGEILKVYQPNEFGALRKIGFFLTHFWMFLSEQPREANTEGGVFPAIFGTFVMTVLMSAAVMPFGVLAAIYLREYASQGIFTQSVRVAVNNLAGVPSIVYGVFGLGFFVYFMGSGIDKIFFSDRLLINEPTFGTGGVLWASLTLALLTVPVVVVATEEALAAVPRGMREASLACGASKWQTIQRIVLPASASGVLTGLILSMARGAGEVAPLMLVGVVKYAPDLPIDGTPPFFHLERKFMHLGFHIYDLGFQSPDSEAAKPMVFATTFLLILLVIILNLGAILIRDHLRKKYASGTF